MKILVLVNTLQSVQSFIYANHIDFFVWTAKNRPDIEFVFYTPHRMSIDNARNTAADLAMKAECDYLMFIDDDVMIPKNTLDLLLKADKDIIAGLVIIRGMPFNVMAFRWQDLGVPQEDRPKEDEKRSLTFYNDLPLRTPCGPRTEGDEVISHSRFDINCPECLKIGLHPDGLQPVIDVDAIGFSCALIKTDVLHQLTTPYFITGRHHTEDVYFCMKVKTELVGTETNAAPTIAMHTGVMCGHLLNPEPIEWSVRKRLSDFYAPEVAKEKEAAQGFHRDMGYIEKCLANLGANDGNK